MRVQKGVKHLLALVTSLIDVVRVEEQIGLTLVPVALADLLRDCVAEARLLAQRKQLKFVVDPLPDLTLVVDPARMSSGIAKSACQRHQIYGGRRPYSAKHFASTGRGYL